MSVLKNIAKMVFCQVGLLDQLEYEINCTLLCYSRVSFDLSKCTGTGARPSNETSPATAMGALITGVSVSCGVVFVLAMVAVILRARRRRSLHPIASKQEEEEVKEQSSAETIATSKNFGVNSSKVELMKNRPLPPLSPDSTASNLHDWPQSLLPESAPSSPGPVHDAEEKAADNSEEYADPGCVQTHQKAIPSDTYDNFDDMPVQAATGEAINSQLERKPEDILLQVCDGSMLTGTEEENIYADSGMPAETNDGTCDLFTSSDVGSESHNGGEGSEDTGTLYEALLDPQPEAANARIPLLSDVEVKPAKDGKARGILLLKPSSTGGLLRCGAPQLPGEEDCTTASVSRTSVMAAASRISQCGIAVATADDKSQSTGSSEIVCSNAGDEYECPVKAQPDDLAGDSGIYEDLPDINAVLSCAPSTAGSQNKISADVPQCPPTADPEPEEYEPPATALCNAASDSLYSDLP